MGKKISVLLMRDDQQVRRYRIDPAWFRLVIYGIFLLIAFSSIGGYLGYTFWHENDALSKEIETLRQQVQDKDIKLKSLQNMERILALHEPDELQSLLTGEKKAEQIELQHPSQVAADQVDLQAFFAKVDLNKAVVKDLSLSVIEEGALRLVGTLGRIARLAQLEPGDMLSGGWTAEYARARHYKPEDFGQGGGMWRDKAAAKWQGIVDANARKVANQ